MFIYCEYMKLQHQLRSCLEFSWNHRLSEVGRDLQTSSGPSLLTTATQNPGPCPAAS